MHLSSALCNSIFSQSIADYHVVDDVDAALVNPYQKDSIEHLLYLKNWIDTVQWHLEDIVRDPQIDPKAGLALKRRIDASNQHRTDVVEFVDSWLLKEFTQVKPHTEASINTESPAWAIDRLSILALKIYHMEQEVNRPDAAPAHKQACQKKLDVLLEQRIDLSSSIDQLLADIAAGVKYMKVYKQMKMYNDESLNPILYQQKK